MARSVAIHRHGGSIYIPITKLLSERDREFILRKGAEEAVVLSAYYNDDKTLVIKLWVPRPGKTLYRYVDDRVVFQVVRDDREVIATYIVVGEQHEEVVSGVGSSQILRLIERMIQYHTENGNVNEAEKLARLINTVSEVEVVRE